MENVAVICTNEPASVSSCSISQLKLKQPTQPASGPCVVPSKSAMICIARIFVPLCGITVPAGNVNRFGHPEKTPAPQSRRASAAAGERKKSTSANARGFDNDSGAGAGPVEVAVLGDGDVRWLLIAGVNERAIAGGEIKFPNFVAATIPA